MMIVSQFSHYHQIRHHQSLILLILMLLHHLQDMVMLILAQPPMFLRALPLLGYQLPIYDLFHLLKIDIPDLVRPHASCRNIAESRVVDLLLYLLLVVLRFFLLELQGHVLVDD